jgi:hypothetical protein
MGSLKKIGVSVVGGALVVGGIALLVLPGPGILLVAGGVAVLATEYVWARNLLDRTKDAAEKAQKEAVEGPLRTGATVAFALGTCTVGVLMFLIDNVPWPALDSLLDSVWSPVTGGVLIATSLVLLGTTAYALHQKREGSRR